MPSRWLSCLAEHTTLRLGGPADGWVEATTEPSWSRPWPPPTTPASRCWCSAAAATSSSPTRASPAPSSRSRPAACVPTSRAPTPAAARWSPSRPGRTGTSSSPAPSSRVGRRRGAVRHPGPGRRDPDPERRRLRPGGRADDRPGARLGPASLRGVRTFANADCGFGYRTSRFKADPGRHVVLDVTFQLQLGDLGAPGPVRRAGPHARRRARRARARWPTCATAVLELRRSKGMVLDAADHDTWSAGSFFTNPVVDAGRASPTGAPAWPAARTAGQDQRRVADRAAPASQGLRRRPGRAVDQAHPRADQPRRRHDRASCSRWPARSATGSRPTFGIRLVNEPVLVGCELIRPGSA